MRSGARGAALAPRIFNRAGVPGLYSEHVEIRIH